MLRLHCFRIVELWGLHQGWKIQFVLLWRYVLSLFKYLTIHKCIVPYSPPSLLLVSTLFPCSSYSASSSSCPAKGRNHAKSSALLFARFHFSFTIKNKNKNNAPGIGMSISPSPPVGSDKYLVFNLHQLPSQSAHVQ